MKFKVHISSWGWLRAEGDSAEAVKAEYQAARPNSIITVVPVSDRKLSAEEVAAQEEAE